MSEKPTFGLVHGSWHGAWCWTYLQKELDNFGYDSIAMDLPIDDPGANFDDYARVVADELEGIDDVILVGHSRAGNVIPRVANGASVRKLIYLCGTFEPATINELKYSKTIPPKNFSWFTEGVIDIGSELTVMDDKMARDLFYPDCSSDVTEWAISKLRPQRRSAIEPKLENWPEVDQEYILARADKVVNPAWSRFVARELLDIEPVEISGGHSLFLSQPHKLAQTLISLAI